MPLVLVPALGVAAPAADRTLWLRVNAPEADPEIGNEARERQAYRIDLIACTASNLCLPWTYCAGYDAERGGECAACAGARDSTGDDGIEAAPVRLEPEQPIEGSICGADTDWYVFAIDESAMRVVVAGADGLFVTDNARSAPRGWGRSNGARFRNYAPGDAGVPNEVVVDIRAGAEDLMTQPYTVWIEPLVNCDPAADPPCPPGFHCNVGLCER